MHPKRRYQQRRFASTRRGGHCPPGRADKRDMLERAARHAGLLSYARHKSLPVKATYTGEQCSPLPAPAYLSEAQRNKACRQARMTLCESQLDPSSSYCSLTLTAISWFLRNTRALAGTDSHTNALPPMTLLSPMCVSPPKMEALEYTVT